MKSEDYRNQTGKLEGATPATLAVAVAFLALVAYFVAEHYFMANEYYVEAPPYLAIFLSSLFGAGIVFALLKWCEPDGDNHAAYAVLSALGVGLATYAFIPRLNIITDQNGLSEYTYELDPDYVWQPPDPSLPPLRLYLDSSEWWRQFKPGAHYAFELRQGGLAIWQINMSKIYDDQKRYYDCNGVISCMTK